jgi:hypothetical protein
VPWVREPDALAYESVYPRLVVSARDVTRIHVAYVDNTEDTATPPLRVAYAQWWRQRPREGWRLREVAAR